MSVYYNTIPMMMKLESQSTVHKTQKQEPNQGIK